MHPAGSRDCVLPAAPCTWMLGASLVGQFQEHVTSAGEIALSRRFRRRIAAYVKIAEPVPQRWHVFSAGAARAM